MISFYNTINKKKEEFLPIDKDKVTLYTCGPTVYNYAHIGNFRAYIFEDLLRRTLEYAGYNVFQVMNITDIDDKTIKRSINDGISLEELTNKYTDAFFEDLDQLNIVRAHEYPRATNLESRKYPGKKCYSKQRTSRNGSSMGGPFLCWKPWPHLPRRPRQ